MLIVMIVVILVVSQGVWVGNEAHIVRDMLLLCEILNVKPKVNHLLLILISIIESHQEVSCDFVHSSSGEAKSLLDLRIGIISSSRILL